MGSPRRHWLDPGDLEGRNPRLAAFRDIGTPSAVRDTGGFRRDHSRRPRSVASLTRWSATSRSFVSELDAIRVR
jgi:hypothetical protein